MIMLFTSNECLKKILENEYTIINQMRRDTTVGQSGELFKS